MPVLDRQAVREPVLPPSLQGCRRGRCPSSARRRSSAHYIQLSVVALVCGAVAITALELGVPLGSPLVKLCVLDRGAAPVPDDRRRGAPDLALGVGLDAGQPGPRSVPAGLVRA